MAHILTDVFDIKRTNYFPFCRLACVFALIEKKTVKYSYFLFVSVAL